MSEVTMSAVWGELTPREREEILCTLKFAIAKDFIITRSMRPLKNLHLGQLPFVPLNTAISAVSACYKTANYGGRWCNFSQNDANGTVEKIAVLVKLRKTNHENTDVR